MAAYWHKKASARYKDNLAATGLLLNDRKTFRSDRGIIFVEKLFVIDKITEEKTPFGEPESPTTFNAARATIWDYIKQECRDTKVLEACQSYAHVRRVDRVQLSAVSLAKRYAGSDSDTTPAWQALPDVLQEQAQKAGLEEWRVERAVEVARNLHPSAFRMLERSGLPLHWPKELGGWGLPGKPSAPIEFRKAAAVILTNAADARDTVIQSIITAHAVSGLPEIATKIAREGRQLLADTSVSSRREIKTSRRDLLRLPEAQAELTAAIAAHFTWLDERTQRKSSIGRISKRIKGILEEVARSWASVKPMKPDKAVSQLNAIDTPLYCPSQVITEVLKRLAIPQDTFHLVYQAAVKRTHSDQSRRQAREILRYPWDPYYLEEDDRYHFPLGIPLNPFAELANMTQEESLQLVRDVSAASIVALLQRNNADNGTDSEQTEPEDTVLQPSRVRGRSGGGTYAIHSM